MRVLLVTSRFPLPAWRGNQVRTVEWLEALAGESVGLVCPQSEGDDTAALPATLEVVETFALGRWSRAGGLARAALLGRPLQEGLFDLPAARAALRRALTRGPWDVVVVQMVRCAWAVSECRRAATCPPLLFDAIDAMGLHFAHAGPGFSPTLRPGLALEAARCRRRERFLVETSALTTAVARRDLAALAVPPEKARLVTVSAKPVMTRSPPATPTVLLSGNLGYRPTVAAARFFARHVWPGVRAAIPEARWVLAGARPAAAVRDLAGLPGVEVHGDVADLADYLARATVALAPMAAGSGVPMKVLEAWAAGVPVVAHPRAAEGLELAGEEGVALASDAGEWERGVRQLLSDGERATALAASGRRAWLRTYHPDRVSDAIREAVTATAG